MSVDSGAGRPGRRRKTDEKIVAAVMALLRTQGPDAVTMDAVTELSGVAKTTPYRRYADRNEMLAGGPGRSWTRAVARLPSTPRPA